MSDSFVAVWEKDGGPGFDARHGLTGEQYQQTFTQLVSNGFRPAWVQGYTIGGEARFAAIFEQVGGPKFDARHNMTAANFQQAFDQLGAEGFGPTCVSGYVVNGEERFAAIWEHGRPVFDARFGLTPATLQQAFDELGPKGFAPTCVSAHVLNGAERFVAVWEQGRPKFDARFGLTPATLQQAFDQLGPQGFGPTCVSGYTINGEDRYVGIWEQGRPVFDARFGLTSGEFQQAFDQLIGQGFRLRRVNAFDSSARATLSHFTFANDISAADRARLIDRHRFALASVEACGNLNADEKKRLRDTYARVIHHTTLNEPGVNASAGVGGSTLNVNFGVLFPQGDEEISQTLIHEMMHCAGFTHPDRRDPPAGSSCAAPNPAVFDCPNDNGQYYGTPALRAEFCIAGDQSDAAGRAARGRAIRKSASESCSIDPQGVASLRKL